MHACACVSLWMLMCAQACACMHVHVHECAQACSHVRVAHEHTSLRVHAPRKRKRTQARRQARMQACV